MKALFAQKALYSSIPVLPEPTDRPRQGSHSGPWEIALKAESWNYPA